jgi:hypothetical protein
LPPRPLAGNRFEALGYGILVTFVEQADSSKSAFASESGSAKARTNA